ncbi:hypothetical protein TIFTF001_023076 [Ficus carica]|uniref:Uncharacterized protein n=1 Tax=Ficus carica TaxID=3494 RepID=A0AA88AZV5_FICCA|nr:hypothetical protein TIFTF001_023076 [Ficus carica]
MKDQRNKKLKPNLIQRVILQLLQKENYKRKKTQVKANGIIDEKSHEELGITQLLEERGLSGTVLSAKCFASGIVHEFYANMSPDISNSSSAKYLKARELDQVVEIDNVISDLTGGVKNRWTDPHCVYFCINLGTWMKFDMGKHIFETVSQYAENKKKTKLPFPSLIYELLMSQKEIKQPLDALHSISKLLKVSKKLLSDSHMMDVQGRQSEQDQEDVARQGEEPVLSTTKARHKVIIKLLKEELKFLQQQKKHIEQREKEIESVLGACNDEEQVSDEEESASTD